ncbi:MAG: NAD(P)/FAD-dependent oxidoreductase [Aquificota bacterium]|nr:NAD(P)/FAD-dependent oxidoreductase [Aquificota bacterium]
MKYDVVVIGAGPAGSTAAYTLARGGARVLLVDFKREVGTPVQCAEFVPSQLAHRFPEFFTEETVVQRVRDMVHLTPWGEVVKMPSEGFMLRRDSFDRLIANLAVREGAELLLRTLFLGFEDGKLWLEKVDTRERFSVNADLVIGADGPRSRVARLTGDHTRSFLTTAQVTVPLREKLEDLVIYFRDYIPGGYGWVFPKGGLANVGVGVDPDFGVNVTKVLERFIGEVISDGWVLGNVVSRTGGWIPAEGVKDPVRDNVLMVGDAGGFCHPITGGGIASAVMTGSMAGEAVLEGSPGDYRDEALDTFGETLGRAVRKRIKYMKSWENLEFIIPRTWIAFEEYWKEE